MNIDRITYFLEADNMASLEDKLYYLSKLFTLAKYLSLDKKIKKWLETEKNNYEIIDFYLDFIEYDLKEFDRWKNINTLNDILELKGLLKEWYVSLVVNDKLKSSIIQAISNFVVKNDKEFYTLALKNVFTFQDIMEANLIIRSCGNALSYIEKIQMPTCNNFEFWVKGKSDDIENSKIMYNRASFFYEYRSKYADFKAVNYLREQKNIDFLNIYHLHNSLFSTFSGKEVGSYIEYSIVQKDYKNISDEIMIDLNVKLGDKIYIKEENFKIIPFMKKMIVFKKKYRFKMQEQFNGISSHEDFSIKICDDIENKPIIIFDVIYFEKNNDYATSIKSRNGIESKQKFDTVEILGMFERLFLHITLYFASKYHICIKNLLQISNKDFLMLVQGRI